MGLFGTASKAGSQATVLIIDIGSGSVGMALASSKKGEEHPEIIWSHREYSLIKELSSMTQALHDITTTIINAFLQFSTEGMKQLQSRDDLQKNIQIQVSISAPWTYTAVKAINYNDENPFIITDTLIEELTSAADKKTLESVIEQSLLQSSGLSIIHTEAVGVVANDYVLEEYEGLKTKKLTLFELIVITHERLLEALKEAQEKILPRSSMTANSFMSTFYKFLRHSYPDTNECCLIDITNEATEIGIVRDNLLRHTSYTPFGIFTIARDIAGLCKIPKEEAVAYIRGGEQFILKKLSTAKQAELDTIITTYDEQLSELFKQNGDTLAIPKNIYLHCDADSEEFFIKRIKGAAKKATGINHTILPITSIFIDPNTTYHDTPILLSAQYFHTHTH